VLLLDRVAPNGEDTLDFWIKQAFLQDTLTDHPRSTKENDVHVKPAFQAASNALQGRS
jgi:hypothetical protein